VHIIVHVLAHSLLKNHVWKCARACLMATRHLRTRGCTTGGTCVPFTCTHTIKIWLSNSIKHAYIYSSHTLHHIDARPPAHAHAPRETGGTLCCEAVVFFKSSKFLPPASARTAGFFRKRAGVLLEKNRFLASQMLGYLGVDMQTRMFSSASPWRRAAASANGMARC
jgi:hypothetical protein